MERSKELDGLKYLLMIFVVIGHFIEPSRYSNIISSHIYSLIYSFHMVLFVWISGFFYKCRPFKSEIKKCIPFFEVCIVLHFLFQLLYNDFHLSLKSLLSFGSVPSWFLLSLSCWRLMTSIILAGKYDKYKLCFISFIISCVAFLILRYGGFMSVGRSMLFYPFFILGYCMNDNLNIIFKNASFIKFCGVVSMVFILLTSCRIQHLLLFHRDGVFDIVEQSDFGILTLFIFRCLLIISSLFICAMLLLYAYKSRFIKIIAPYGKYTLFIYFFHTLLYAIVAKTNITLIQSLVLSLIILPILTCCAKLSISKFLMQPISSICLYIKRFHL